MHEVENVLFVRVEQADGRERAFFQGLVQLPPDCWNR